jgi:hypothetical protein
MQRRPTLSSSCARAATAAEARFRIGQTGMADRTSRIIALDDTAADLVLRLGGQPWHGGRFLVYDQLAPSGDVLAPDVLTPAGDVLAPVNGAPVNAGPVNGGPVNGHEREPDAILRTPDGLPRLLSAELDGADVAVLVATPDTTAQAASVVAGACASRWIMSAGLVVAEGGQAKDVVAALRPATMVLVVLRSSDDIAGILSALRV